jgi:hypothetical protein
VEVFDSGMLRPKKTLLAVFGLTRHTDRLRRLTDPCSLRELFVSVPASTGAHRTGGLRDPWGEQVPVRVAVLDQDAEYSVNRKALKRWAEERLSMHMNQTARSTRCSAMREPLAPTWAGR